MILIAPSYSALGKDSLLQEAKRARNEYFLNKKAQEIKEDLSQIELMKTRLREGCEIVGSFFTREMTDKAAAYFKKEGFIVEGPEPESNSIFERIPQ